MSGGGAAPPPPVRSRQGWGRGGPSPHKSSSTPPFGHRLRPLPSPTPGGVWQKQRGGRGMGEGRPHPPDPPRNPPDPPKAARQGRGEGGGPPKVRGDPQKWGRPRKWGGAQNGGGTHQGPKLGGACRKRIPSPKKGRPPPNRPHPPRSLIPQIWGEMPKKRGGTTPVIGCAPPEMDRTTRGKGPHSVSDPPPKLGLPPPPAGPPPIAPCPSPLTEHPLIKTWPRP